jgi:aryl-alcohol dehydrogenase-like predicted oxidoreductase
MEFRSIGALKVSVVGLGCNNFGGRLDAAATATVVKAALDAGINFFDTADMYGGTHSEEFLGQALGAKRRDVVIATKFGAQLDDARKGAKPAYIQRAVEDSLRRLGTDYIDLYQLHWPDPETPVGDTLAALDALVKAGKVREIGCSNFSVEQLREAEAAVKPGAARFVSVQNEYNLLHREPDKGVMQECEQKGLAFLPYFPLASGLLAGKYRPGQPPPEGSRLKSTWGARWLTEENIAGLMRLQGFASSKGHGVLELAMSWLLARPAVASVIAGATKAEQVQANVNAAGWKLTAEELAEIDRVVPVSP